MMFNWVLDRCMYLMCVMLCRLVSFLEGNLDNLSARSISLSGLYWIM